MCIHCNHIALLKNKYNKSSIFFKLKLFVNISVSKRFYHSYIMFNVILLVVSKVSVFQKCSIKLKIITKQYLPKQLIINNIFYLLLFRIVK